MTERTGLKNCLECHLLLLRRVGGVREYSDQVMRGVTTMQIGLLGSAPKNMLELVGALVCKGLE